VLLGFLYRGARIGHLGSWYLELTWINLFPFSLGVSYSPTFCDVVITCPLALIINTIFYSWFKGYALFSWCLLSWWQQWWLQIEVLWWWWWSLQWLIGKSVSSCFGHHFLKTFVLLLRSSIWFKKHLWDCKGEILLCFITYVSWKKYLWIHGWEISFCFVYLRELKKNHLWTHKCAISFFLLFLCESKKPSVQYQLFSSPMWMKKPTCGPVIMQPFFYIMCVKKTSCGSTSVEYSFLSSFIGVRKSLASSQGSNVLSCLFILLWLWPSCCSQCNFWHWSSCWFFVRVYVQ
jgi:hypothetical protein